MKWLLLLVLVVLVGLGVQQWLKGTQDADLRRQLDAIKTQAIREAEAAVGKKSEALKLQETRLQAALADLRAKLTLVDQRLKSLNADLAKQDADRKHLVEQGTLEETLELGRRLGYHPRAVP